MEDHHLLLPLLPTTTTTTVTPATVTAVVDITRTTNALVDFNYENGDDDDDTIKIIQSNSKILLRLISVALVGILSIWANHEASQGFEIDLEISATDSAAGGRFQLLYVSNDKATRLVFNTSKFVETILYLNRSTSLPNKKQVNRVTLRLTGSRNLTHMVTVESIKEHEFVLHLSPSNLEDSNFDHAMLRAVQQGMARVWLYDNNAPNYLVNGMVEYISSLAGLGAVTDFSGGEELPESDNSCWKDENPMAVARFLNYCEENRRGFIQRLNQAMSGSWHNRMVDDALGLPAQHLCGSYR